MGRIHVNAFSGFGIDPAAKIAAAWENKRVYPVRVDDGQFEVNIRRRGANWPPSLAIWYSSLHEKVAPYVRVWRSGCRTLIYVKRAAAGFRARFLVL